MTNIQESITESILDLSKKDIWNMAVGYAIEVVRDVYRESPNDLNSDTVSVMQSILREYLLEE